MGTFTTIFSYFVVGILWLMIPIIAICIAILPFYMLWGLFCALTDRDLDGKPNKDKILRL